MYGLKFSFFKEMNKHHLKYVCFLLGERPICLQNPPSWNSWAAEEVQCQEEAKSEISAL